MNSFTHRYIASILVEASTPLKVGTGEKGVAVDELAVTDVNGLPMIPGTSICGVLRHDFEESKADRLFGFQKGDKGEGSRLIFSDARFVGIENEVMDGLKVVDFNHDFYSKFTKMALRDHCRINHKGVADKAQHGKFDSQLVYKGCRFVFEIELIGKESDKENWEEILQKLNSPLFRIGGGTRKGFGELEIIAVDEKIYDLTKPDDLTGYLKKSSKLIVPKATKKIAKGKNKEETTTYILELKPDDFFMFSSGFGDKDVDAVAKKEIVLEEWDTGNPKFSEEKVLIPATSVKGAIAHRTAFHYNKLIENYADKLIEGKTIEASVGEHNEAVAALFGFAKNSEKDEKHGARGKVLFSDVYLKEKGEEKIFNHVAIDRFTGGAMDGALFDEKVVHTNEKIELNITVENSAFEKDENIQKAFEAALKDITTGMLPLGGSVMRGHGCFNGTLKRDGEEI